MSAVRVTVRLTHPTGLHARQHGDLRDVRIPWRQAQRFRRDFELALQFPTAFGIDRVLQLWRTRRGANNAGGEASRRLQLQFWGRPVEIRMDGDGRVAAIV